jgi:hypothetical protein
MESRNALAVLGELSSAQWGLITSAQAARRGVSRLDLSRLADASLLERVSHGVYRDAGAAPDEFDGLRAAWLAIEPKHDAEVRLADLPGTAVVSGTSAAYLHGIGDLRADRYEFTTPVRRQSQRPGVHFTVRSLDRSQITVRQGLPVTTVGRTLADLIGSRADLTHVANALGDALRQGGIDLEELARMLAPLSARNGLKSNDGSGFVHRLLKMAGMDAEATVDRIAAIDALAAPIATRYLEHVAAQSGEAGQRFAALSIDSSVFESMRALTESYQKAMRPQMAAIEAVQAALAPQLELQRKNTESLAPAIAALTIDSSSLEAIRALTESYQKAMRPQMAAIEAVQAALAPQLEQQRKIAEMFAPSIAALTSAAAFASRGEDASSVHRALVRKAGDVQ